MRRTVLQNPQSAIRNPQWRCGFTLVEMLVSVALVLLMMLMFSSVFREATRSMSQQKGMAENDQKARTLTILLRSDLGYQDPITGTWHGRTFKDIRPFQHQTSGVSDDPNRQGYFYIAESDVASKIDDLIQFTIVLPSSEPALSGRAQLLQPSTDTDTPDNYLADNSNQPEFDDGQTYVNNTGSSRYAEVSYFLRNGNLYRRVLLIRQPYDDDGTGAQPAALSGDYSTSVAKDGSGNFWQDFDYSAYYFSGAKFHHSGELTNTSSFVGAFPLGIPKHRFGHFVTSGMPREFLDSTFSYTSSPADPPDPATFIGRFTHQETAHSDFGYPGRIPMEAGTPPVARDPFNPSTPLSLDSATGLVSKFETETDRRGEDVLLSNVHEFDIKVWDDGITSGGNPAPQFVDLGHSIQDGGSDTGYYNAARNRNPAYGNRYDTWHPNTTSPNSTSIGNDRPPFMPVNLGANGVAGAVGDDDGANGDDDVGEEGWISPSSDDTVYPLKAIQITVRYYDVSSDQMRQLTLVHSLIP